MYTYVVSVHISAPLWDFLRANLYHDYTHCSCVLSIAMIQCTELVFGISHIERIVAMPRTKRDYALLRIDETVEVHVKLGVDVEIFHDSRGDFRGRPWLAGQFRQ